MNRYTLAQAVEHLQRAEAILGGEAAAEKERAFTHADEPTRFRDWSRLLSVLTNEIWEAVEEDRHENPPRYAGENHPPQTEEAP